MGEVRDDDAVRPRPPLFRALGRAETPERIVVGGRTYTRESGYKHDSWAATALYESDGTRIIAKFNRVQPIGPIPMRWLGRLLARREAAFLDRLADVALVPANLGPVSADGMRLDNAVARAFVPGEPWRERAQIEERFFEDLRAIVAAMHARDMAYVDLHKRENVIVGPGGRPHLIDFQVSFGTRPGAGPIARAILRRLQEMDDYHVRKHYARLFPERLSAAEREAYLTPPGSIALHRRFAKPIRRWRRALLVRLGIRDRSGMAASEHEPEIALRPESGASIRPKPPNE